MTRCASVVLGILCLSLFSSSSAAADADSEKAVDLAWGIKVPLRDPEQFISDFAPETVRVLKAFHIVLCNDLNIGSLLRKY